MEFACRWRAYDTGGYHGQKVRVDLENAGIGHFFTEHDKPQRLHSSERPAA